MKLLTKSALKLKRMFVPVEIKEVSDQGVVDGYASIFGNVDLGGDVISKDQPFKEIVRNEQGKVLHLFQHDSFGFTESGGLPLGLAEVDQNSKGLKFKSQLVMDDPFVQRVHKHFKAGTLTGMSIGYDILPGGANILKSGVRELTALKLWEISSVTFGMNPEAGVAGVKSAIERCVSVRELEDVLRDAAGLSRTQAKRHAGEIWKTVAGQRDADAEEPATSKDVDDLVERIKSFSQ